MKKNIILPILIPRTPLEKHMENTEKNLRLNLDEHKKLKFSKKLGLTYATSVWDLNSTKQIIKLDQAT